MEVLLEKKVLLGAMQGAKNVYPKEFIALFQKTKDGHMLIIPPFSEYGDSFSSFNQWALPPMDIEGSFHSHPGGRGEPSHEDLLFFSKVAKFHIVAFPPFSLTSFKAFSFDGKQIEVKVV